MVLRIVSLILLAIIGGCATAGYERYGIYDEKRDSIYQHRASFVGDSGVGMAYSVVYWEALKGEPKEGERPPELYYIWLRNNRSLPVTIDPGKLSLFTEKGVRIRLSRLTGKTISPLKRTKLDSLGSVGGYVAFDVPMETMEEDKPSRLVYDDDGNRAGRYLLIDDMKKYEGLIIEATPRYYAPVYPREYWYPYYYPYAYYPYDLRHNLRHWYEPHRQHYYYSPSEPKERKFYTPPPSNSYEEEEENDEKEPKFRRKREFK